MTRGTSRRKADHLRITLEEDVAARGLTAGFERVRLPHVALPEIALDDVVLETTFLGHSLGAPLMISSMTGGTPEASVVNQRLAAGAQEYQLSMGVGSLRAAVEDPAVAQTYAIRDVAPDILLLANIGAVQLNYGFGIEHVRRAMDIVGADALILHTNPLQEALQPEGNTDFRNLLKKVAALRKKLNRPIVAKEVGWGISGEVARTLVEAGVDAIDVAGAGGTSWSAVERFRISDPVGQRVADHFRDWGLPTVDAIQDVRHALPDVPLVASGGLRTGIDAAKAIALGADVSAMALPFLRAAAESEDAVDAVIREMIATIRIALFATGSRTVADLRTAYARRAGANGQQ
ncbi:MAG: type 2 isopentenyl-diphosphate Delta-isomerase [Actinobacteria bacterium]|nr:type 2 isopentenyl-diphosphate Delta-isomerase [Actinomycetota bacterium]